ncbi:MAG: glutamine amidotransferase [Tepidisphaeraceae bacterium]
MSTNHVLYLGDSSLSGAAAYLAGLMTRFGIGYDYVPSDQTLSLDSASLPRKLFILSDYAAANMPRGVQEIVLAQVRDNGAGLLMIGGWESFHGHGGNWDGTPIGAALPVEISSEDDRINCDQPALLIKSEEHAIVAQLPWNNRPPTVGGFNRVVSKPRSATILIVQRFAATFESGRFNFNPQDQDPMLVLGAHGKGRTAALMTDLAPHWVGGLVDWGDNERVTAQAPGGGPIEVGNFYSQLVANLLAWTGQLHGQHL